MPLPQPHPGLVLLYAYSWRDEHRRGLEEGVKHRPCVIITKLPAAEGGDVFLIVPITHRPNAGAVEIPASTKQRLGLDDQRSWIVTNESNRFRWPGHDLRQIPGKSPGTFSYGTLPPALFRQVIARYLEVASSKTDSVVPR